MNFAFRTYVKYRPWFMARGRLITECHSAAGREGGARAPSNSLPEMGTAAFVRVPESEGKQTTDSCGCHRLRVASCPIEPAAISGIPWQPGGNADDVSIGSSGDARAGRTDLGKYDHVGHVVLELLKHETQQGGLGDFLEKAWGHSRKPRDQQPRPAMCRVSDRASRVASLPTRT